MSAESVDYFFLLPEDIIQSHILPKLSTIEAARTCILSKRWKSLWTSFPYLDFYQFQFQHIYTFRNFVDKTIKDHARNETDILRFKLYLTHCIHVSDIDNWIRLVMSRNVREFHFHYLKEVHYPWPSRNLCMANTITLLELYYVRFSSTNITFTLPHLETLHFDNVLIDQKTFEKFLSGCPSMSDLKVWSCHELQYLAIANHPQLKRVCIGNCMHLEKLSIFEVPCLQSLTLSLTKFFLTLNHMGFTLDEGAYDTLKELHLCNYSNEENALQVLLEALTNLEILILESVKQCSQNMKISSLNLKKVVFDHCEFLIFAIAAPNLTSVKCENNHMFLYLMPSCNIKDYIFSNCCNYSTGPDLKRLRLKPLKKFLMNSNKDLHEGTKMIIDLNWCNYTVVLEDRESIAKLPYEVIDDLFPKAICISNMSFSHMADWFLSHSFCFSQKLLLISSTDDSKLYEFLKEKMPDSYIESSSFTMNKENFESNTKFSLDSMNNINVENDRKIAFLNALFEVGFNTKQVMVLEFLLTSCMLDI